MSTNQIGATLALLLVLALGACGGNSHSAPTAQAAAAHAKALAPSNAVALAEALGCANPALGPFTNRPSGYPAPTGEVGCTANDGVRLNIQTYPPKSMAFFNGPAGQAVICADDASIGYHEQHRAASGADFRVIVTWVTSDGVAVFGAAAYLAATQAVADQLGTKVWTLTCPA